VQYFPDIEYLLTVLSTACRLVSPGGVVFIGDVRNLRLLEMFHGAVQLSRAAASVTVGQLRRRIARAVAQEKELVIDPRWFQALSAYVPNISAIDVQLKRGRAPNELTRYRYDVVLRVGLPVAAHAVRDREWRDLTSVSELIAALEERRWEAIRLVEVPNSRLSNEAAAQRLIETSDESLEVGALRRQLSELQVQGVDPEEFWELGRTHGYDVQVSWSSARRPPDCYEVQLSYGAPDRRDVAGAELGLGREKPWSGYANDPLENGFRQNLISRLRERLAKRLPEHMTPSAWMVLKELPLTINGKLDRDRLPAPHNRPDEMGEYVAPHSDVERKLADIWAQVLRVDQVGIHDSFFELGGHSLLATQVVARIRSSLSIDVPIRLLFELPTIGQLSAQVDKLRDARLLEELSSGRDDIQEVVDAVAAMSDTRVRELVRELAKERHV
jgi:polyketide synthase PksJ